MADRIDPEIRPESFPGRKISQNGIGSASAITTGASEWLATFRLPEQLGQANCLLASKPSVEMERLALGEKRPIDPREHEEVFAFSGWHD